MVNAHVCLSMCVTGMDDAGRIVTPLQGQTGTAVWVFWERR